MIVICTLVLIGATLSPTMGLRTCPNDETKKTHYQYDRSIRGYVKLHNEPADWDTAVDICRDEGGIPLSPITNEIQDLMVETMKSNMACGILWTGMHNHHTFDIHSFEGNVITSMTHIKWANPGDECNLEAERRPDVVLEINREGAVRINDKQVKNPFMCIVRNDKRLKCGCVSAESIHDRSSGRCYTYYVEHSPIRFEEAVDTCAKDASHLAVFDTEEQLNFLARMVENIVNKDPVTFSDGRSGISIGIRTMDMFSEKPLRYYNIFGGLQKLLPKNQSITMFHEEWDANGEGWWGFVHKAGVLGTTGIRNSRTFICQKDAT